MSIFNNSMGISTDTVIRRKHDVLFNEIDGEVVMLSVKNSEYYGIDEVGSRIWELLESPLSVDELIGLLTEEYDVSQEQCRHDTLAFLEKLSEKDLLIPG